MNLSSHFSKCFFVGHDEPMKVMRGKVFRFECGRCGQDLGAVLPGQRFKARKMKKAKKRKSADVLTLAERRKRA